MHRMMSRSQLPIGYCKTIYVDRWKFLNRWQKLVLVLASLTCQKTCRWRGNIFKDSTKNRVSQSVLVWKSEYDGQCHLICMQTHMLSVFFVTHFICYERSVQVADWIVMLIGDSSRRFYQIMCVFTEQITNQPSVWMIANVDSGQLILLLFDCGRSLENMTSPSLLGCSAFAPGFPWTVIRRRKRARLYMHNGVADTKWVALQNV